MLAKRQKVTYEENEEFSIGTFLWAKIKSNDWWPAVTVEHSTAGLPKPNRNQFYVFWFGDHRVSEVSLKNVCHFKENFSAHYRNRKKVPNKWTKGVNEAIREFGFPHTNEWNPAQLLRWALSGFSSSPTVTFEFTKRVPDFVFKRLAEIKELNNDSDGEKAEPSMRVKMLIDIAISNLKPGQFCLGCYSEDATEEHPLFEGLICEDCKKRIKNSLHTYGDDGICYYCTVCGYPGEVFICSKSNCGKVYCENCIDNLTVPNTKKQVKLADPWLCFFCKKQPMAGLIQPRTDWKYRLSSLFRSQDVPLFPPPEIPTHKTKLRVLSLFDGIGTGLLALDRLNLCVEEYYSCEIDSDAISVTQQHFGDRITNLGDIRELTKEKLISLLPIDLLVGGSPCNDLSLANPKRKGIGDMSGSGVLFFDFYRILTLLNSVSEKPFFWLLENVASMPSTAKEVISRFLQCEPKLLDAVALSPQKRPRLFWGNLPTLEGRMPIDEDCILQNYLMSNRTATVSKLNTVTTKKNSLKQGSKMLHPVKNFKNKDDTLWSVELEQVFGFPAHYTDVGNLSATKRQQLIGRAWSVPVICYLFRFLLDYFESDENNA